MQNRVAIIPARGGSKRLPRKNILPLLGKPMIAYPIAVAQESGLFSQIIVSSEDEEILDVASEFGAYVQARPQELATDTVGVVDVCRCVLEQLGAEGVAVDQFCCLYATAALIEPHDLIESQKLLDVPPQADFVMGVSNFNMHPYRALDTQENGFVRPRWPDLTTKKQQELPDFVASNGTLYWARTEAFLRTMLFYDERTKGYVVPGYRAVDLDSQEDYEFMRMIMEARQLRTLK